MLFRSNSNYRELSFCDFSLCCLVPFPLPLLNTYLTKFTYHYTFCNILVGFFDVHVRRCLLCECVGYLVSLDHDVNLDPSELKFPFRFPISVIFLLISSMRNMWMLLFSSESSVIRLYVYILTVLSSVCRFLCTLVISLSLAARFYCWCIFSVTPILDFLCVYLI